MNRKRSSITLGPGAASLILIFVVLSLTALGMLSLMTSRNDFRFAERSASVTQAVYALNVRAEERRAELDGILASCAKDVLSYAAFLSAVEASLPEEVFLEDDLLLFTEGMIPEFLTVPCAFCRFIHRSVLNGCAIISHQKRGMSHGLGRPSSESGGSRRVGHFHCARLRGHG